MDQHTLGENQCGNDGDLRLQWVPILMKTPAYKMRRHGFTLLEMLITVAISGSVFVAILSVYLSCIQSWNRTTLSLNTTEEASTCLDKMIYGVGTGLGLRASYSATNLGTASSWQLRSSNYNEVASYNYNPAETTVSFSNASGSWVIGTNIIASTLTSTVNSVAVALTVLKTDGRYSESNTVRTFVKLRAPLIK